VTEFLTRDLPLLLIAITGFGSIIPTLAICAVFVQGEIHDCKRRTHGHWHDHVLSMLSAGVVTMGSVAIEIAATTAILRYLGG